MAVSRPRRVRIREVIILILLRTVSNALKHDQDNSTFEIADTLMSRVLVMYAETDEANWTAAQQNVADAADGLCDVIEAEGEVNLTDLEQAAKDLKDALDAL